MDGVVEIITGRERRRRWSTTDKLRLVAETEEAGASVRGVAASHGICESLLFTWRRQVRQGTLVTFPRESGHGYGLRGRGELFHLVG
jgi:transposase